jgi:hypothetical protein
MLADESSPRWDEPSGGGTSGATTRTYELQSKFSTLNEEQDYAFDPA